MKISSALKLLALGTVIGTGGLVVKNQHDEINTLRQDNDALVKRLDTNEQAFAIWGDKQTKEFALALESTIQGTRKDLGGEIRTVKETNDDLSGRVLTLEGDNQTLSNKLGSYESTKSKLEGRITKLETRPLVKTDEQKRVEIVKKFSPSVVDITVLTPRGTGLMTGCVTDDRKGNLVILTCGHYVKSQDEFLETDFQIHLKNGFTFEIKGHRMPDGSVPWSSADHRDFSVIRLTDEMQTILKKHSIKPIPIMAANQKPVQGASIVTFGKEGKVLSGTLNATNYYQWQGRWRTDYQTDAPIKRGDSGGPTLNLDGEMVGITAWGPNPEVTITGPKELVGKLKINVDAHTGVNFFVSNIDLLRGLGSVGYPLTKEERNHLLKIDVLEDRPYLLSPPVTLGQSIGTPLLTYLSQLSELDGYAFRK